MNPKLIEQYYGLDIFFHPDENTFKAGTFTSTNFNEVRRQIKAYIKLKHENLALIDKEGNKYKVGAVERSGMAYILDENGQSIRYKNFYYDTPQTEKIINALAELEQKRLELNKQLEQYKFEVWKLLNE